MGSALPQITEPEPLSQPDLPPRFERIYRGFLLKSSPRCANFDRLSQHDLALLFELYDEEFFKRRLPKLLGERRLKFRVSERMTSCAGKTIHRKIRTSPWGSHRQEFEIAISSMLLCQTFCEVDRSITVSGIVCWDRLEALQRVFEHELVHLLELLVFDSSNCSVPRFRSLASTLFGHRECTHGLITPRERALKCFGIRLGDRVTFHSQGERLVGVVNRITKRATVLVEDERGSRYTDGKRYARFYVPLSMLQMEQGAVRLARP
jgi:hypothetical protein